MTSTDMLVRRTGFRNAATKKKNMKTQNSDMSGEFGQFILSNEEMICVRGGDDGTGTKPPELPVKI